MVEFAEGETKELNVALTPIGAGISVSDLILVLQASGDAAETFIYCNIKNEGSIAQTLTITAYYWEEWMGTEYSPAQRQSTFTVNPGETYVYKEHHHGNRNANCRVWLVGNWIAEGEILFRPVDFIGGYKVTSTEIVCTDVGPDYAVLRYAQYSVCDVWNFVVKTPPVAAQYEQRIKRQYRSDEWGHSIYALFLNLLPGRTYEGSADGGPAWKEAWTEFTTPAA